MTKKNLIDLIIHKLSGGNTSPDIKSKYHPEIITKYIELAFNSLINTVQNQSIRYKDLGQLDSYVKTYSSVTVSYDDTRKEYYSDLPVNIIGLYMNRGIRYICPIYDQSYHFIYRKNNSTDIYSELEVSKIDSRPRYYLEGTKVFYDKMTTEIVDNGVLMKLIVPISVLDEDDEIPIPAGQEQYVIDFIMKYLQQMFPEDVNNDTNSKQA